MLKRLAGIRIDLDKVFVIIRDFTGELREYTFDTNGFTSVIDVLQRASACLGTIDVIRVCAAWTLSEEEGQEVKGVDWPRFFETEVTQSVCGSLQVGDEPNAERALLKLLKPEWEAARLS